MSGLVLLEPMISIAEAGGVSTMKRLLLVWVTSGLPYLVSRVARLGKVIISVAAHGTVLGRYWTYRNAG